MDIIGICGLSSCGKSTLSRYLNKCALDKQISSHIIEMDCVFDKLKRTLFSKHIKYIPYNDHTHICLNENPITTNNKKIIIKGYEFLRNILVNILIKKELYKLKKQNFQLIIIEGVNLNHLNIPIDYRIKVTCDYSNRLIRKAKRERKTNTTKELELSDYRCKLTNNDDNIEYDFVYNNSGSLEELEKNAKKIYKKYRLKTVK